MDKHRPTQLSKLDYHLEQAERLQAMVVKGNFPHLLVYGPPGAGKKTRIMCLLKELYGPGVEKLRMEHQNFTVNHESIIIICLNFTHFIVDTAKPDTIQQEN